MGQEPSEARRTNVLLEQIQSELHGVAEGHDMLARGISRLEDCFGQFERRFGMLEQALGKNNVRLEEVITRFDAHERAHTT